MIHRHKIHPPMVALAVAIRASLRLPNSSTCVYCTERNSSPSRDPLTGRGGAQLQAKDGRPTMGFKRRPPRSDNTVSRKPFSEVGGNLPRGAGVRSTMDGRMRPTAAQRAFGPAAPTSRERDLPGPAARGPNARGDLDRTASSARPGGRRSGQGHRRREGHRWPREAQVACRATRRRPGQAARERRRQAACDGGSALPDVARTTTGDKAWIRISGSSSAASAA
jgi:hypothetical protein